MNWKVHYESIDAFQLFSKIDDEYPITNEHPYTHYYNEHTIDIDSE